MDTPLLRIRRNGCKRMYDGREVQWFVGSKALSLVLECELLRRNPLSELIQRFGRHVGARCLAKSHVLRKILEHFRLLLLNHDNFVEHAWSILNVGVSGVWGSRDRLLGASEAVSGLERFLSKRVTSAPLMYADIVAGIEPWAPKRSLGLTRSSAERDKQRVSCAV